MNNNIPISVGYDEYYGLWFLCPSCKSDNVKGKVNYCDNCGTKLNWVGEEELGGIEPPS